MKLNFIEAKEHIQGKQRGDLKMDDRETRRLYRSDTDKMICGVCGGIGEYLGVDPTVVRLVFVVLGLLHVGIILYIAAAILMPTE